MKGRIVVGANYGDEGKGTVVAHYTKHSEKVLNVLTNGGAQRGHSILTEDGSMTFQHFGSGTYHGADNYYSHFFILNPLQFIKEYNSLIVKPVHIFRDVRCRWSTPYDMMANIISEQLKKRQASCGMGIWNTIKRSKELYWPLFDHFMQNQELQLKFLEDVKKYYEKNLTIPKDWRDIWDSPHIAFHFLEDCRFMYNHTTPKQGLKYVDGYENLIFENGQGLCLCDTGKDTFETTPSQTGIAYAKELLADLKVDDVVVSYVTRPYETRHGAGMLTWETSRNNISSYVAEDRTNHYNDMQGNFRYGLLDIPLLQQRIERDAQGMKFEVEVTHCDEMDRTEMFKKHFDKVNTYDSPLIV